MKANTRNRRAQAGFTMIELMVSLVLFSLVITGMLSVATTMATGYRDQEVTVGAEVSTRAAMDYISDALRGASPGVSDPSKLVNMLTATCETGAFKINNNRTLAGLSNTFDELTVVMASGSVVTTYNGAATINTNSPGAITVVDASQLTAGDYVVLTNFDTGHLFKVTAVAANTITLFGACGAPSQPVNYPTGSTVIRAARVTFSIDLIDGIPCLTVDGDAEATGGGTLAPQPVAEGVEDLEVVVGTDDNADGVLAAEPIPYTTTDEWHGNIAGDTNATGVVFPTNVRAIRVSLVARTAKAFTGTNTFKLGALEDRAANAATDDFRRRTLSSTIEIRNLSNSP